jgi:hypothetical protein
MGSRLGPGAWVKLALLLAPLAAFSSWVTWGALHRSQGPALTPRAPTEIDRVLAGFPAPEDDLPAARLEERVDGAAEALRAKGCRRLVHWRLADPPADLEVLVFETPGGARAVFEGDAGKDRSPGPGDEALGGDQFLYFRRGAVVVRLLLDPGAPSGARSLARTAERVDAALQAGAHL